jgi:hypothetical protein
VSVLAGSLVRTTLPAARPPSSEATGQPPAARFPARPVQTCWTATTRNRGQVLRLVTAASVGLAESRIENSRRRGLPLLLEWLEEHPGTTWQERWLASGADAGGDRWATGAAQWLRRTGRYSPSRLELTGNPQGEVGSPQRHGFVW